METIYLDDGDFKCGGDSHCSLRSLQLLMCVDSGHLFQSFEKSIFTHKCSTSGKVEKAKHGAGGSESTL